MHQPLKTILFKCFDLLPSKYAQSRNGWSAQSVVLWLSFIGFASFLCTVIFLAGTQPGIFNFVNSVPLGDKIGHFVLMGIFSMLANQLFGNKAIKVGVAPILAGSMLIFIPIFFEEISQLWIVTRTFSFFDLVADMLGIIAGGLVSRKIGSRIY